MQTLVYIYCMHFPSWIWLCLLGFGPFGLVGLRAEPVRVAVASNFAETLEHLVDEFSQTSDQAIELSLGSTGKLYAQIHHGAPFDLFFAADRERPERLEEEGLGIEGTRRTYALGRLALWVPKSQGGPVDARWIARNRELSLALANPELAPYGRAARQFLSYQGLFEAEPRRWIRGENIGQTFQFVASGAAPAGLVARSQIESGSKAREGSVWIVPPDLHDPIEQQVLLLREKPGARDLLDFLSSAKAQAILRSFGYDVPEDALGSEPGRVPSKTLLPSRGLERPSPPARPSERDQDWVALRLTFLLALVTTSLLLLLGTPLAWWLARSRWRGKVLVEALVALPIVLPPTVLGFYLLLLLGPQGPLGILAQKVAGTSLVFRFEGLVLGSLVYSLPFVIQPLQAAFEGLDERHLEAAATLGASPWDRFLHVVVPLCRPGFLTASVLGFAHTLGEFGVVLMVGGNLPGETKVLSIAIYDHVETLDYARAHALAGGMLGLSFFLLLVVYTTNSGFRRAFR